MAFGLANIGALCPSKSGLMNKHIVKHRRSFLNSLCLDQ